MNPKAARKAVWLAQKLNYPIDIENLEDYGFVEAHDEVVIDDNRFNAYGGRLQLLIGDTYVHVSFQEVGEIIEINSASFEALLSLFIKS